MHLEVLIYHKLVSWKIPFTTSPENVWPPKQPRCPVRFLHGKKAGRIGIRIVSPPWRKMKQRWKQKCCLRCLEKSVGDRSSFRPWCVRRNWEKGYWPFWQICLKFQILILLLEPWLDWVHGPHNCGTWLRKGKIYQVYHWVRIVNIEKIDQRWENFSTQPVMYSVSFLEFFKLCLL